MTGLASNSAGATTTLVNGVGLITNGNGQLTGASNVSVDGILFDVSFLDSSCISLFSGCNEPSDFAFATELGARLASAALLDQVFVGVYDTTPNLILGIEDANAGEIYTPWDGSVSSLNVRAYYAYNSVRDDIFVHDKIVGSFLRKNRDLSAISNEVYADWTRVSAVPLPPSAILFGSALLGLGAMRRRKKQQLNMT